MNMVLFFDKCTVEAQAQRRVQSLAALLKLAAFLPSIAARGDAARLCTPRIALAVRAAFLRHSYQS